MKKLINEKFWNNKKKCFVCNVSNLFSNVFNQALIYCLCLNFSSLRWPWQNFEEKIFPNGKWEKNIFSKIFSIYLQFNPTVVLIFWCDHKIVKLRIFINIEFKKDVKMLNLIYIIKLWNRLSLPIINYFIKAKWERKIEWWG